MYTMIKELERTMAAQNEKPEVFNKEKIKSKTEMKNTITEMKNTLKGIKAD